MLLAYNDPLFILRIQKSDQSFNRDFYIFALEFLSTVENLELQITMVPMLDLNS